MSIVLEPKAPAKLYIIQQGYNHAPVNTQGAERVVEDVTAAFAKTSGRRVLFSESFGPSEEDVIRTTRTVRNKGFMFHLASQMVGSNDERRVAARMAQFTSSTDRDLVNRGVIATNNVHTFFMLRGLEPVRDATPFDFVTEGHRRQTLRRLETQYKNQSERGKTGVSQWQQGQFDLSLGTNRAWFSDRIKFQGNREPEIHDQLKALATDMQRDPNGGVLFISAGFTHGSFLEGVQKLKFRPNLEVVFEDHTSVPAAIPELVIDQALRRGEQPEDLLYARDMMMKRGMENLVNDSGKKGTLYELCKRLDSVIGYVTEIVNDLSIEDIRKFCEQKQAFTTFIKQFPQGAFIASATHI